MIKKTKVLLIITDFGSFNNFLAELTYEMLSQKKFEIHVICSEEKIINTDSKFKFNDKLIKFHFIDIPRSFNLFKQFCSSYKINKMINKINPIITHVHFTTAIFTTVFAYFGKTSNTLIGTFHGLNSISSSGIKKYFYKLIESYCFLKLDKIILINKLDYTSIGSAFANKVYLLKSKGLGCDLNLFNIKNYSIHQIQNLKDHFNIHGQFVLTFIGRFVHFKGFDITIKTFLKLSTKYQNKFKLILIGGFDTVHSSGLSDAEKNLVYNHKDILIVGFVSDVYKYLSIVDLLIFPSKKEGFPIVVTESLAMGVPVISFNSRGTNELITNDFNGVLISNGMNKQEEINSFVKNIAILLQDDLKFNTIKSNTVLNREQLSRTNFITNEINMYYNLI